MDNRYLNFSAVCDAFKQVLKNGSIKSVGGLDVAIMQNRNFLFYQSKIEVNVGSTKLKVGPKPVKVPFGNVGSGSFSVNFLSSQAGDWPAVLAIHMHFGNIGILWGPEHNLLPLVIKDCTYDKLIALSKETYGVEVSGLKIG